MESEKEKRIKESLIILSWRCNGPAPTASALTIAAPPTLAAEGKALIDFVDFFPGLIQILRKVAVLLIEQ